MWCGRSWGAWGNASATQTNTRPESVRVLSSKIKEFQRESKMTSYLSQMIDSQREKWGFHCVCLGLKMNMEEFSLPAPRPDVCVCPFVGVCRLTASIAVTSDNSPSNLLQAELTEVFNKHRRPRLGKVEKFKKTGSPRRTFPPALLI